MKLKNSIKSVMFRMAAILLAVCMLTIAATAEGAADVKSDEWVTFILQCNEGMTNEGGNAGNTLMVVSMNNVTGTIRLMIMTWDTFIEYEGYDLPQKIDMPYRNNGPEETMRVFNSNFGMSISRFMSLNYSNLASLIDAYDGVDVNITKAERNALNSMVASKKDSLLAQVNSGTLGRVFLELVAQDYYLDDFGPNTHLRGLQAVGYGWLQYDSVYNCCLRETDVVSNLFSRVATSIGEKVAFYTEASGIPDNLASRRAINIEAITDKDIAFLRTLVAPIFEMTYNNLTEEDINSLTIALAKNAFRALRQGVNIFNTIETAIFPLEALQEYDVVAGAYGHLIDYDKNA